MNNPETILRYEEEPLHKTATRPSEDFPPPRADLEKRVPECDLRMNECSRGCGLPLTDLDEREHSCIAELRSNIELLRSEMIFRMDDQRKEMEVRMDLQRGHMEAKEAAMQANLDELKSEIGRINVKVKLLLEMELKRRHELDTMQDERRELLELLRDIQTDEQQRASSQTSACRHCSHGNRGGKVTTL